MYADQVAAFDSNFDPGTARATLDSLLSQSAIYRQSSDYQDLLAFVVRLRNFAPFNAMLLQIQKPGLSYAASEWDWLNLFERKPKPGVRPLLILWPFGPVALVYDVMDTEGKPLPDDVSSFLAAGHVDDELLWSIIPKLEKRHIAWNWLDAGDHAAGSIRLIRRDADGKGGHNYRISINQNHAATVQFTTLAHELAHLCLGHFGPDTRLHVPKRRPLVHAMRELEAESVAYLVSSRNGVVPKSQVYLSAFVTSGTSTKDLDMYQIMRATGQVETMLGLSRPTKIR